LPLPFSLLLALSCVSVGGKRESRSVPMTPIPPQIITAMEIGRVRDIYTNLPDFVAYGHYTLTFLFNRSEGTFKMYKLSDTIYVKLDDGRTFVIPWDTLMSLRAESGEMVLRNDSTILRWDGNELVLVDDLLAAYRGGGINLRLENYSYEPLPHPTRIILRSMGVKVRLTIDSLIPLP